MPPDAWALLVLSVGLGLGLELAYMRARRRDRHTAGGRGGGGDTSHGGDLTGDRDPGARRASPEAEGGAP